MRSNIIKGVHPLNFSIIYMSIYLRKKGYVLVEDGVFGSFLSAKALAGRLEINFLLTS